MHLLERTVRCAILPPGFVPTTRNSFAGAPSMVAPGIHAELSVQVRGDPAHSGYVLDIKVIDAAVREVAQPMLEDAARALWAGRPPADDEAGTPLLLARLAIAVGKRLPQARRVRWALTPFHSLEVALDDTAHALIRQRFDFAAAHRLHLPHLSDADNRALFGKCNNPRGHGHNYQFEPCVRVPVKAGASGRFDLPALEALCDEVLLSRFDHKHLNDDTPEFDQSRGGVNPSVENIAKVFHDLLGPRVAERGARLVSMTVWETDRTSATYPA